MRSQFISSVFCREHEHFILLCLRLLSTHLSLALVGGGAGSVLGNQARPLRNLLFRLVDTNMPQSVHTVSLYVTSPPRRTLLSAAPLGPPFPFPRSMAPWRVGNQARPLRNLLFRLVDTDMPQSVHNVSLYVTSPPHPPLYRTPGPSPPLPFRRSLALAGREPGEAAAEPAV